MPTADMSFRQRQPRFWVRTPPTPPYEPRYYDYYYNDHNYLLDEYNTLHRRRRKAERRRHRRHLLSHEQYPEYRYPIYLHDHPEREAIAYHADKDHNQPYIHYLSPRLLLPHEHVYVSPQEDPHKEVIILKPKHLTSSEAGKARAVLHSEHDNFAWDAHCYFCRSYPQISSKKIPSMYYDQLRCPHCAAHAQPTQQQVLAYPWTVHSYNNQSSREGTGLDKLSVTSRKIDVADMSVASQGEVKSVRDAAQQSSYSDPVLRSQPKSLRPLRTRRKTLSTLQQKPLSETNDKPLSVIQEDEITPIDSISNVRPISGIRAQASEPIYTRMKPRAETEVDLSYPREKYFKSLHNSLPPVALSTPRPQRQPSTASRTFHGQYFDRQLGKTYTYNVNYAHRNLRGNRDIEK